MDNWKHLSLIGHVWGYLDPLDYVPLVCKNWDALERIYTRVKMTKHCTNPEFCKLLRNMTGVIVDEIDFSRSGYFWRDQELLRVIKTIKKLNIRHQINAVDGAIMMKSVTDLNLDRCNVEDKHARILVDNLVNLECLNLGHSKITDVGLEMLSYVKSLVKLELGFCLEITDEGIKKLGNLKKLRNLNLNNWSDGLFRMNDFMNQNITDVGISFLSKKLQHLVVGGTCVGMSDGAFEGMDRMEKLCMNFCSVLNAFKIMCVTQLRELSVRNCRGMEGFWEVVGKMEGLKKLDLGRNQVTHENICALKGIPKLRSLIMDECTGITDEDIEVLATFVNLRELNLIGWNGRLNLEPLRECKLDKLSCDKEQFELVTKWECFSEICVGDTFVITSTLAKMLGQIRSLRKVTFLDCINASKDGCYMKNLVGIKVEWGDRYTHSNGTRCCLTFNHKSNVI